MEEERNQRINKESDSAFEALFNEHYAVLSAFAYRFIKDEDNSKDVVQNVFIKLFAIRTTLSIASIGLPYLYKAVYNECLNELRSSKIRRQHSQVYADSIDMVYFDHAVEQNEKEKSIYLAIEKLPPRCKEIFILSRVHGKKNHEIAEELGISGRTVETQISLALKSLRKVLLTCFLFFY